MAEVTVRKLYFDKPPGIDWNWSEILKALDRFGVVWYCMESSGSNLGLGIVVSVEKKGRGDKRGCSI